MNGSLSDMLEILCHTFDRQYIQHPSILKIGDDIVSMKGDGDTSPSPQMNNLVMTLCHFKRAAVPLYQLNSHEIPSCQKKTLNCSITHLE